MNHLANTILQNDDLLEEIVLKSKDKDDEFLYAYEDFSSVKIKRRSIKYPPGMDLINLGSKCLKKDELIRLLSKL